MMSAAELNSENASASLEVSGQEQAPGVGPAEPDTAPPKAADAKEPSTEPAGSGEGAKAETAPPSVAPSVMEGATLSAGETDRVGPASEVEPGASPVATESADAAKDNRLGAALAALDRRDYATAKRLFEAVGRKDAAEAIDKALAALDRKDYTTARGLFEALAASRPTAPVEPPPAAGIADDSQEKTQEKQAPPPLPVVPFVAPAHREPARPASEPKARRSRLLVLAASLALLAILGAALFGGTRRPASIAGVKSSGAAALASAFDFVRSPLAAISGAGEDERAAIADLRVRLAKADERLDRIERETGARLDKLGQQMDENSAAKSETPAAASSAPAPDVTDLGTRLDRLEKNAAAPASGLADVAARLDRLEKKMAADPTGPPRLADVTARLDKLEKRVSAQTANAAKPVPPSRTGAQSPAPNDVASLAGSRRLLQNYAVEDVQDGVAVVASRYGAQQVVPGDYLPGAGRVLRIERRGGDWYVLTSNGVIASAPY